MLVVMSCVPISHVRAEHSVSWRFDTKDSEIRFELAALGVVPIRGTFERFTGEVWRDADSDDLRVFVRIDATSLSMQSGRYRDWARSPEFFHVDRYPEIAFKSEPISWNVLSDGGVLSGMLTVRGKEREVEFEIAPGDCRPSATTCMLHVVGEINRTRFGMRSRRLALSSRVYLDMSFRAVADHTPGNDMAPVDQDETRR
jgi:polyisoprenoid-binding protein YceI